MKKINLIMLVLFSWNAFAQVPFQLGNDIQNRKVVLFQGTTDNHQYFGFGINPSLLRYQVDSPSSSHAFFSGASASESNELMRITGIGYVGIGISSPNAPLQFANTTANRKLVLYEVANNDNQYFGLGINAGMFRYQVDNSSSVHAFYAGASSTTSNELMRITGTGNVGIGR
jgi:ribosomal protein L31